MISFIIGNIEEKTTSSVVVENNGIGYELCASSFTLASLPLVGEQCKIYTYLQAKDDGITLFGFADAEEREMFYKLISVSGVGPKMAITILSGMPLTDLIVSILNEDLRSLSGIKGLGKKTAERLIVELKDQVSTKGVELPLFQKVSFIDENALNDACEVLISLGVPKNDALRVARENAKEYSSAEDIIASALRSMGR